MSFKEFEFAPCISEGIKLSGFKIPTAIKLQAIPYIFEVRDVTGHTHTRTGMTADVEFLCRALDSFDCGSSIPQHRNPLMPRGRNRQLSESRRQDQ